MQTALLPLLLSLSALPPAPAVAEKPVFTFVISGPLVDKLPEDTVLKFWTIKIRDADAFRAHPIQDLPLKLPEGWFLDQNCTVYFESEKFGKLFSVDLSRDLFDSPRKINIKLDKPKPHIRPEHHRLFGYFPCITKRMSYHDLPYWHSGYRRLAAPRPPIMKITRLSDGAVLFNREMEARCWTRVWWAGMSRSVVDFDEFKDGHTYRCSVEYHSGGLYEPIKTTFDFTYRFSIHGR
ncbi:MAG: hypothetical protein KDB01_07305 [Planctomycetaceae bacterium]|nr:hypothetical protein [Planctomycetaceae bacterium]